MKWAKTLLPLDNGIVTPHEKMLLILSEAILSLLNLSSQIHELGIDPCIRY